VIADFNGDGKPNITTVENILRIHHYLQVNLYEPAGWSHCPDASLTLHQHHLFNQAAAFFAAQRFFIAILRALHPAVVIPRSAALLASRFGGQVNNVGGFKFS